MSLDFSITHPIQLTLSTGFIFPILLLIICRVPHFSERNALQFLLSFLITTFFLLMALTFLNKTEPVETGAFWVCFFFYCGMMLIYLEMWGLLSRGYTLGLLLTFYKAGKGLQANEIASLYRSGEGLDWLIKHRFKGLISAKMIKIQNNHVTLTVRGRLITYLYQYLIFFFGLRYSG